MSPRASLTKTGIITTTTGVLFTTPDRPSTDSATAPKVRRGAASAWRTASCVIQSSVPVRTSAPTMMNMAAMVQGAGLANVAIAALPGTMPSTSIRPAAPMAVTSTGKISLTKTTNMPATIASATTACTVGSRVSPSILHPALRPPSGRRLPCLSRLRAPLARKVGADPACRGGATQSAGSFTGSGPACDKRPPARTISMRRAWPVRSSVST